MNKLARPPTERNRTLWQKGVSGNPGGRPKASENVRDLARAHTVPAINALVKLIKDGKSESAVAAAAEAILSRGWGKPLQQLEVKRTPFDEMNADELRSLALALQDLSRTEERAASNGAGSASAGPTLSLSAL